LALKEAANASVRRRQLVRHHGGHETTLPEWKREASFAGVAHGIERMQRAKRDVSVVSTILLLAVTLVLAGCDDGYPDNLPRLAGSWFSRQGACPDLRGDYQDVSFQFMLKFGLGSSLDLWNRHHAHITQAVDGSWLDIELGLSAAGMRAARGERGKDEPMFSGLGRGQRLRLGDHYRCRGGWLHVLAREGSGDDNFRYESTRFAKDRSGGLIAEEIVSRAQTIGWADSRAISLGRGHETRWSRWPLRDPGDAAAVAALEGVRLTRADWINNGRSVPTYFSNFHLDPICARLVREWRIDGQKPIISLADEIRRSRDEPTRPFQCPQESGEMASLSTTIWQIDVPEPDSALGDYRVEWQRIDQFDRAWNIIPIKDVRTLPIAVKAGAF